MTVCESLAGFPPSTQLAVCQLRHRQDLSLSVRFLVLACSTASTVQIALSDKSCLFLILCLTNYKLITFEDVTNL